MILNINTMLITICLDNDSVDSVSSALHDSSDQELTVKSK